MVRKHNARFWMLPGGKAETGETPLQTMQREVLEETGIILGDEDTGYLGHFEAKAANEPDHMVSAHVFYGQFTGEVTPMAELAEVAWHMPGELATDTTAPLLYEWVVPALREKLAATGAA